MADSIDDFYTQRDQAQAKQRLAGVSDVPPETAGNAIKDEPATGMPASVGMRAPEVTAGVKTQQDQARVLATSPETRDWVLNAPPAHIAAAQDDLAGVAKIAAETKAFYTAPWQDLFDSIRAYGDAKLRQLQNKQTPEEQITQAATGSFLGAAGDVNQIVQFGQQAALNILQPSEAAASSQSRTTGVALLGPKGEQTAETVINLALAALPFLHAGFAAGPKPPPIDMESRVIPPEGAPPNAPRLSGTIEPFRTPPEVKTTVEPSPYTSEPAIGTPPVGFAPETDAVHSFVADQDAEAITKVQDALAESKLFQRAPTAAEALVEQHTPGANAYIDAQALVELGDKIPPAEASALFPNPTSVDAFINAHTAGAEYAIPLSQYLAATAGKPWAEALNKITRFSENGVSQEQASAALTSELTPAAFNPEVKSDPALPDSANEAIRQLGPTMAAAASQAMKETYLKGLFENGPALGTNETLLKAWSDKVQTAQQSIYDKTVANVAKKLQFYRSKAYKASYEAHYPQAVQDIMARRDVRAYHQLRYGGEDTSPDLVKDNALVENGKPITFYHGSGHVNIEKWEVPHTSPHTVMSFSYDPGFASRWATNKGASYNKAPVVYLVHLKAKNPADFRKPADVAKMVELYRKRNPQESYEDDSDYNQRIAHYQRMLEHADWSYWEQSNMWKGIKPPFDAAHMKESSTDPSLNIAIENGDQVFFKYRQEAVPTRVKLAEADRGQFSQALRDALPRGIWAKDGAPAEDFASELGFDSAEQMLKEIAALRATHGEVSLKNWLLREFKLEAARRAEADNNFSLDPAAILEEARSAVAAPAVEDLLIGNLQNFLTDNNLNGPALARVTDLPLTKEDIKAAALDIFNRSSVKDGLNIRAIQNAYRGNMQIVEKGLLTNKPEDILQAFKARQQALLNFYRLRSAYTFARQYGIAVRSWQRLAARSTSKRIDQDFLNQIHVILKNAGLKVNRQAQELSDSVAGVTLSGFMDGLRQVGLAPAQASMPTKSLPDMTVQDFKDLKDMLASLRGIGEAFNQVGALQEQIKLSDLGQEVAANASELGRRYPLEGARKARFNFKETLLRGGDSIPRVIGAYNLRPETYFFYLDRDKFGPLMKYVVGPLSQGRYVEADLHKQVRDSLNDFYKSQPKGWEGSMKQAIDVPELPYRGINWIRTRGDAVVAALNLGTVENFNALAKGYNWDQTTIEATLERVLRPEDWAFVQKIWDTHEQTLWPEVVKTYRDKAVSGVPPRKKAVRNFSVTPPGGEPIAMRGGYFQIEYDHDELARLGAADPTLAPVTSIFGPESRSAAPANNYTKTVTGFAAPVDLNFSSIPNRIEQIIHDIAFRKPLIQAQKVLSQPDVVAAVQEVLGPEYVGLNRNWLEYIAREALFNGSGSDKLARWIRGARANFTSTLVLYRLSTMLVHVPIAASHMIGETGVAPTFEAATKIYGQWLTNLIKTPGEMSHWMDFIDRNSGELRNLEYGLDRDTRDAILKLESQNGPLDNFAHLGYNIWTFFKKLEGRVTWLARYHLEMGENMDHDSAVGLADKAVRDTQGAGSAMDLPPLYRGGNNAVGEFGKTNLTLLMGFHNTTFNRSWRIAMATRRVAGGDGTPQDWHILRWLLAFVVFPGWWLQQVRNGYNRQNMSLAEAEASNLVGSIPLGELGVDLAFHGLEGKHHSPAAEIAQPALDLFGKRKTPIKDAVDLLGFGGLAAANDQFGTIAQAASDIATGAVSPASPLDAAHTLAAGPPRRRR